MASEKGLIIDGLLDLHAIDGWEAIVSALDIAARRRSVSQALVSLCVFHAEKTPSFWMYPDERAVCYGCSAQGTRGDIIAGQVRMKPSVVLDRLGVDTPGFIAVEIDTDFLRYEQEHVEHLQMRASLTHGEEPF